MIDFEKLFNPRSIGIIGVNEKRAGRHFVSCLLHIGFEKKFLRTLVDNKKEKN